MRSITHQRARISFIIFAQYLMNIVLRHRDPRRALHLYYKVSVKNMSNYKIWPSRLHVDKCSLKLRKRLMDGTKRQAPPRGTTNISIDNAFWSGSLAGRGSQPVISLGSDWLIMGSTLNGRLELVQPYRYIISLLTRSEPRRDIFGEERKFSVITPICAA